MLTKGELQALALSDDKIGELLVMSRAELEEQLGTDFSAMKDYNQNNPHHHLALLDHTLAVVLGIKREDITEDAFVDLRISALFHDIAKPAVRQDKAGRSVYYAHAEASRKIAENLLSNLGFSAEESARILFLIGFHDAFIPFRFSSELEKHHSPYLREINADNVREVLSAIRKESEASLDFSPSGQDFGLLVGRLCPADQDAQAETVIWQGSIIDTRRGKKARLEGIYRHLKDAAKEAP